MSNGPESGAERTLTVDEDDPHTVWERDGGQCYICGALLDRGIPDTSEAEVDGQHAYPLRPDRPPNYGFSICGDCWMARTNEQLDKYLYERQARQWALEEDPGDYRQNQGRAFERDDHTCQLCGNEGIPKAERGLIAYPVRAGDYHLNNLVTICDDCLTDTLDSDEDDQTAADRLRIRAARAQEWINTDDDRDTDRDGDDANRAPDGGEEIPIPVIVPVEATDDEDTTSES
jgi:5-methylcytosine-specific restriction endonuclease McrA